VISFAPASSRKIAAAIVEHNPTSRSYIHCTSAKEDSRIAAYEHLLVITEDLLHRLMDVEGITSSGWLPATPQSQHAATYSVASVSGSVAGSMPASRRSSATPQESDKTTLLIVSTVLTHLQYHHAATRTICERLQSTSLATPHTETSYGRYGAVFDPRQQ
jgi:hypothetical protein